MDWLNEYQKWLAFEDLDTELRVILEKMKENERSLQESFSNHLAFGTGGMRAEMGPGINRLNIYTIRRASEGLGRYIIGQGGSAKRRGVVIAYDSRNRSAAFALEAVKTIGKQGISVYLFNKLMPTPLLSYAVRYLNAFSGIVITASHNPPEYNGYKVYGEDGGQLPPEAADKIIAHMNEVENELTVQVEDADQLLNEGLLTYIDDEVITNYLTELQQLQLNRNLVEQVSDALQIVYTPLHGAGNQPVCQALASFGFTRVNVVPEQELPDGNFPTATSPNPEESAAFELAITLGRQVNADILLATDPDADRLGIAIPNPEGEYHVLTGNQIGALLLNYLLSQKKLKGLDLENGIVFKTIVTSELGRRIATFYGCEVKDTLTGFKYISEQIQAVEESREYQFQFGYEESNGYLFGAFVREKDAVQAAVLAAEMAAYYKAQNKTVYDGLQEIYEQFGFYEESLYSLTLKGQDGAEKITSLMAGFRNTPLKELAGIAVQAVEDYQVSVREASGVTTEIILPKSNVLKYFLEDESWFCLRPSGTEPKIKLYIGVRADSSLTGQVRLKTVQNALVERINQILG